MKKLTFDIEANGLQPEVNKIWCISFKEEELKPWSMDIEGGISAHNLTQICKDKVLIGHNIIAYDIPVIKQILGIDLIDLVGMDRIIDTMVMSKVLNPDRVLPKGCPTSILNPITKKRKIITPHSLEAHAFSLGYKKIEIHDWTVWDKEIVNRCEMDVTINEKVYYKLCKEANLADNWWINEN